MGHGRPSLPLISFGPLSGHLVQALGEGKGWSQGCPEEVAGGTQLKPPLSLELLRREAGQMQRSQGAE